MRTEREVELKSNVLQDLRKSFLMPEGFCSCVLQRDASSDFGVHTTSNRPDYGFKRQSATSKQ